jgi:hypothetical protein
LDLAYYGSNFEDRFVNKGLVLGDMNLNGGMISTTGRGGEVEG